VSFTVSFIKLHRHFHANRIRLFFRPCHCMNFGRSAWDKAYEQARDAMLLLERNETVSWASTLHYCTAVTIFLTDFSSAPKASHNLSGQFHNHLSYLPCYAHKPIPRVPLLLKRASLFSHGYLLRFSQSVTTPKREHNKDFPLVTERPKLAENAHDLWCPFLSSSCYKNRATGAA